jgi:Tol biopolymer transport system component
MGNVGQHYFAWRYPQLGPAWSVSWGLSLPIYYASNRSSPHWQVGTRPSPSGFTPPVPRPDPRGETVPYSVQRSFDPDYRGLWLLVDSRRGDGAHRQLYTFNVTNPDPLIRLTYTDGAAPPPGSPLPKADRPVNDYNPAVSPDGTKLAFVSDRAGQPHLFLMGFRPDPLGVAGDQIQLTSESCTHQAPSWSPDGRSLIWMANCAGNFDLYAAEVQYAEDSRFFDGRTFTTRLSAKLINVRRLTTTPTDDVQPRLSPDGTTIAFEGQGGGRSAIFLMDADGGNIRRLTNSADNESAPSWSPDGRQLVYAAQRDGRWRLRIIDRDGRNEQVQSHEGAGDDRWPVWAH